MCGHTQPHLTKRIVEKERSRKSNKILEVRRWMTRGDWWPERSKLKPRTSENETRPMKASIYLEYTHKCSQLVDSKLYSRQESEKQAENKEKYFNIFRNIKKDIASLKQKQDKSHECQNSMCFYQLPTSCLSQCHHHPLSFPSQKVESDPLFFSSP